MYQDFFNKNDDYLSEFKQKVANQKIATVEERRAEMARSRNNFLGTFAGIALAGIVGWFVLAPQYSDENNEIVIIRRPQTAVKIKPENPGGMDIPNQDKDIYSLVEKKNVDTTVVENLLPTPEKPKLPDIVPEVSDIDENAKNLDEIVDEVSDEQEASESEIKKVAENEKTNQTVPEKPKDLLNADKPAKAETPEKKADPVKSEAKTAAEVKEVAKTTGGAWQIQLMASKNKDAVEKAWNNLSAKYSQLKGYSHEIQTSDLGAQGIFYRLRAGSFATKAEAAAACSALKAKGLNDCIAKER